MKSLIHLGDNIYPTVSFDVDTNNFKISGRSLMDDAEDFYKNILNWLEDFAKEPSKKINFSVDMECFNIASSKRLLFMFYKLDEMVKQKVDISVDWYFQAADDDMYETGKDFEVMVNIPFIFHEVEHQSALA